MLLTRGDDALRVQCGEATGMAPDMQLTVTSLIVQLLCMYFPSWM
jgi:hypothetical protein